MPKEFKGTSPLVVLADGLPVRARIGLTLVAADLALERLEPSHNYPIARAAFELERRWFDGERFDPDRFEDAVAHEYDKDLVDCEMEAKSEDEVSAWLVLEIALLYTASHAGRALGKYPTSVIAEVDENALDEIDKSLRAISPAFISTMAKAARYLQREPGISFARLKSEMSKG